MHETMAMSVPMPRTLVRKVVVNVYCCLHLIMIIFLLIVIDIIVSPDGAQVLEIGV